MTAEELAKRLNGRQYGSEIARNESEDAADHGLLVAYGYSDDNLELAGVICDEISAFEGCTIRVDWDGVLYEPEREERETLEKFGVMTAFQERWDRATVIKAVWGDNGGPVWKITANTEHYPFDIMEDGEVFCRGLVLALPQPS